MRSMFCMFMFARSLIKQINQGTFFSDSSEALSRVKEEESFWMILIGYVGKLEGVKALF